MDFDAEFNQISKQMLLNFKRVQRLSNHPGLKGGSAESIVRLFLSDYLPKNLEISTGQIFDTNNNISHQLDIIIHDKSRTPVLYMDMEKNTKLIPVECVYAVIEVKSHLDKRALMRRNTGVFDNMLSVRKLEKKAFYEDGVIQYPTNNYGKEWVDWPINYYTFAFDSIDIKTVRDYIDKYHKTNDLPPEKRIDMVCVLGKGIICNQSAEGLSPCPDTTSTLRYSKTEKELLLFYALISHLLFQVYMRKFKFLDYIKGMSFVHP